MRSLLLLLLLLGACAEATAPSAPEAAPPAPATPRAGPMAAPQGRWREQTHLLPVQTGTSTRLIQMRFCRPEGSDRAPLVLINHGSPPDASARSGFVATRCDSEAARWFLARGFAVGAPLRRGYGASGGNYVEGAGSCDTPDFHRSGVVSAGDIRAALSYARGLPGVDPGRPAVVVGQSAGGWATLALAAEPPEGVGAFVAMAAGRGGWARGPNTNCRPELLASTAGRFGATARLPMLWVYTENDSFFAPAIAKAMHEAFTAAGGRAELKQLPAWRRDGHGLFFGQTGSDTWGPLVEEFLRANRALPAAP